MKQTAAWMVRVAFPVCTALAGIVALVSTARETPAALPEADRILTGREAVVLQMVRNARGAEQVSSIEIDHTLVRVHRSTDASVVLVRRHDPTTPPAGETPLGDGVSLACPSRCDPGVVARVAPFARRLARSRAALANDIWNYVAPVSNQLRLAWRSLFVALAIATAIQASLSRWAVDRRRLAGLLVVLAAGVVTLLVAHVPLLPAHDHNTFIARADCAIDPSCTRAPRGAWGMPSLAIYGMFLGLGPYRLLTLSAVSLAFAALSAALLVALVTRLATRSPLADRATLTGTLAGLFLVCHPAFVRVAAADTPWPFVATCLILGGLSALRASEPEAQFWEPWVAVGWLGIVLTSNYALLGLTLLAVLTPWCFARGPFRPRFAVLPGFVAWALLVGPTAREAFHAIAHAAPTRLHDHVAATLALFLRSILYFDVRLTPPTWGLLAVVGLAAIVLHRMRVFGVLVVGAIVTQVPLGFQVQLETGYPTFFVHGFMSHYFFATFAALGAATALGWLRSRHVAALAGLAAVTLLPWTLSRETVAFARERRPLSLEARALSAAFDRLPPHDVLVIPPDIARDLDRPRRGSDPVEYSFPHGELAYVFRRRGLPLPRVVSSDQFLRQEPAPGERVFFYLGSSFRTFLRSEIDDDLVPASLERPELSEVRARFGLAPVLTFDLPTAQNPFAAMRVMADRAPHVTLGFYRLTPLVPTGPDHRPDGELNPGRP